MSLNFNVNIKTKMQQMMPQRKTAKTQHAQNFAHAKPLQSKPSMHAAQTKNFTQTQAQPSINSQQSLHAISLTQHMVLLRSPEHTKLDLDLANAKIKYKYELEHPTSKQKTMDAYQDVYMATSKIYLSLNSMENQPNISSTQKKYIGGLKEQVNKNLQNMYKDMHTHNQSEAAKPTNASAQGKPTTLLQQQKTAVSKQYSSTLNKRNALKQKLATPSTEAMKNQYTQELAQTEKTLDILIESLKYIADEEKQQGKLSRQDSIGSTVTLESTGR